MQNNQEHLVWSLGHKPLQQQKNTQTRVEAVTPTPKQHRAAFYAQSNSSEESGITRCRSCGRANMLRQHGNTAGYRNSLLITERQNSKPVSKFWKGTKHTKTKNETEAVKKECST